MTTTTQTARPAPFPALAVASIGLGLSISAGLVAAASSRTPTQAPLPVEDLDLSGVVVAVTTAALLIFLGSVEAVRRPRHPDAGWALIGGALVAGAASAVVLHGHLPGLLCILVGATLGAVLCAVTSPRDHRRRRCLLTAGSVVAVGTAYGIASGRLLPRQPDNDVISWVLLAALVVSGLIALATVLVRPSWRGSLWLAASFPGVALVLMLALLHQAARINYVGLIDGECCVSTAIGVSYPTTYVRAVLAAVVAMSCVWVWAAVRRRNASYLRLVVVGLASTVPPGFPLIGVEASSRSALTLLALGAVALGAAGVARWRRPGFS